jgi:hypothetical protein
MNLNYIETETKTLALFDVFDNDESFKKGWDLRLDFEFVNELYGLTLYGGDGKNHRSAKVVYTAHMERVYGRCTGGRFGDDYSDHTDDIDVSGKDVKEISEIMYKIGATLCLNSVANPFIKEQT